MVTLFVVAMKCIPMLHCAAPAVGSLWAPPETQRYQRIGRQGILQSWRNASSRRKDFLSGELPIVSDTTNPKTGDGLSMS
jgi:hypothetical protein